MINTQDRMDRDGKNYIMTFWGTFLAGNAEDWVVHMPWNHEESDFFLVGSPTPGSDDVFPLLKQITRPRALPNLIFEAAEDQILAIKCHDASAPPAQAGKYFCCLPGEHIEVNRGYVSDWEKFMLVEDVSFKKLLIVLRNGTTIDQSGQKCRFEMLEGFKIRSHNSIFYMQKILSALPVSLSNKEDCHFEVNDSLGQPVSVSINM